jgi:hypothetical protein
MASPVSSNEYPSASTTSAILLTASLHLRGLFLILTNAGRSFSNRNKSLATRLSLSVRRQNVRSDGS